MKRSSVFDTLLKEAQMSNEELVIVLGSYSRAALLVLLLLCHVWHILAFLAWVLRRGCVGLEVRGVTAFDEEDTILLLDLSSTIFLLRCNHTDP